MQSFPKIRLEGFRVRDSNIKRTYSGYLRLLSARHHRPDSRRTCNNPDEVAPPHGHPPKHGTSYGGAAYAPPRILVPSRRTLFLRKRWLRDLIAADLLARTLN